MGLNRHGYRPSDKAFAILLANVALGVAGYLVLTHGYRGARPTLWETGYFWVAVPVTIASLIVGLGTQFALFFSALGRAIVALFVPDSGDDGDAGEDSESRFKQLLTNAKAWWARVFLTLNHGDNDLAKGERPQSDHLVATTVLTAITIGTYWSVVALIQSTGGAISSPFGEFAVGFVLLAPMIMTSRRAPILNILAGTFFVLLLTARPYALDWIPLCDPVALPAGSTAIPGAYAAVAGGITLASLAFPEIARWAGRSKSIERVAPTPTDA